MSDVGGVNNRGIKSFAPTTNEAPPQAAGSTRTTGQQPPPPVSQPHGSGGPPPLSAPTVDTSNLSQLCQNIRDGLMGGDVDFSMIMQKLEEVQHTLDKEQLNMQGKQLEAAKDRIKTAVDDKISKIRESITKMEDEKKWELAKTIFSGVAVGLALVGAAATGGGLAIAAAAVGATMFTLQTSGLADKMFDAVGADQQTKMWVMVGISVGLLLAGGGGAIHSFMTGGASSLVQALSSSERVLSIAANTGQVAQVFGGLSQIGQGGMQVGKSVVGFELAEIEHEVKGLDVTNLRVKQQQDELMEEIREILDKMDQGVQVTAQVVQGQSDAIQSHIRNLS